jgi:hypothetical protein
MPKYKAIYTEYHRVSVIHSDSFDTTDKEKWQWLKSAVEDKMDVDDFELLSDKPPTDPAAWFALYQHLSSEEYEDKSEDWETENSGDYDVSRELEDSKGKVIASD